MAEGQIAGRGQSHAAEVGVDSLWGFTSVLCHGHELAAEGKHGSEQDLNIIDAVLPQLFVKVKRLVLDCLVPCFKFGSGLRLHGPGVIITGWWMTVKLFPHMLHAVKTMGEVAFGQIGGQTHSTRQSS